MFISNKKKKKQDFEHGIMNSNHNLKFRMGIHVMLVEQICL